MFPRFRRPARPWVLLEFCKQRTRGIFRLKEDARPMLSCLCNLLPVVATGIKPHTLFSLQLQSTYVVGKRGVECLSFSTHNKNNLQGFASFYRLRVFPHLYVTFHSLPDWRLEIRARDQEFIYLAPRNSRSQIQALSQVTYISILRCLISKAAVIMSTSRRS